MPTSLLIKTICYPSLYKVNTKATRCGQKHKIDAIKAYEASMKARHVNLVVKKYVGYSSTKRMHFSMPPLIFLCRVTVVEVDVGKLNVQ